jgi:hypothetical protein
MINALKKQITAPINLVIKIQKKGSASSLCFPRNLTLGT